MFAKWSGGYYQKCLLKSTIEEDSIARNYDGPDVETTFSGVLLDDSSCPSPLIIGDDSSPDCMTFVWLNSTRLFSTGNFRWKMGMADLPPGAASNELECAQKCHERRGRCKARVPKRLNRKP